MTDADLEKYIRAALDCGDPELLVAAHRLTTAPYYNFRPRPDRPEQLDEQTSYVTDEFEGISCVIGGNRSGKTRASAWKVARFLRQTPPPDPTTRFWVVGQTMEMASGVCWSQHLAEFLPEATVAHWYSKAKGYPASVLYDHPNGGRWLIEFKSYDMGRSALQAAAIAGFWLDEQIEYKLLTEILARTSNYKFRGNKLYSLTPLRPDFELESIFSEQEKHPGWRFYRLNTLLNATVDASFLDHELDELKETRTTGAFASYSGAVYKAFGSQHVVEPFPILDGWKRIAGIDFGWDHPTTAVFVAKDLAGRYWVYDEYAESKTSIEEHVTAIKLKWVSHKDNSGIWADHAAAQDRHEFAIRGLPTMAANKDVFAGIARIQQLLRPGPDGKPGLFISKKCEGLIKQMRTYQWHPTQPNRVLKQNDDLCDSLRYALASESHDMKPIIDLTGAKNKRFQHSSRP